VIVIDIFRRGEFISYCMRSLHNKKVQRGHDCPFVSLYNSFTSENIQGSRLSFVCFKCYKHGPENVIVVSISSLCALHETQAETLS
jgi:hypothetical protein